MEIILINVVDEDYVDVHRAIEQAVVSFDAKVSVTPSYRGAPDTRLSEVSRFIQLADLIIADISGANANVMHWLGFALSSKKPIITIGRKDDQIPYDIAQRRNLIYDRIRLQETLTTPLEKLLSTHNIRDFIPVEQSKNVSKTVFVSYSHKDVQFLNRLQVHMRPFEKNGLIDLWVDTKIKVGEKWKDKISKALDDSAIAILLISADFLASDFIVDNELPPLLKRAEEKGKYILPVILKPCRFLKDNNLSKFQAINDPNTPLSKMNENDREEIYAKIADYVEGLVKI